MTARLTARVRTAVTRATAGRDSGQGTLEYIGMIAVAALLVMAVVTAFGDGSALGGVVEGAIEQITSIGG